MYKTNFALTLSPALMIFFQKNIGFSAGPPRFLPLPDPEQNLWG